jgi:polysaccharide deacetylase family protein (PEP-CTERM system associated)
MRSIPSIIQTLRDGTAPPASPGLTCLSIDVEEYFHAETFARHVSPFEWPRMERRVRAPLERLALLFERHNRKATFFVLGWTVAHLKPLLRQLAEAGHEIACHGDRHAHLSRMTPRALRGDLRRARAKIEDAVGVRPTGYRAPTFSITRRTAWALDVLIEEGFAYDASIFPIRHDRYGVPDAPVTPFWAVAPSGARLLELPPLTMKLGPLRIPVGGGGYLRLLPGWLQRACVARQRRGGRPAVLYVHPWELDPNQPVLPGGRVARWRHRVGLRTTEGKIERLLAAFESVTMNALADRVRRAALPEYALARTRGADQALRLPRPSSMPAVRPAARAPQTAAPRPTPRSVVFQTGPAESDRQSGS